MIAVWSSFVVTVHGPSGTSCMRMFWAVKLAPKTSPWAVVRVRLPPPTVRPAGFGLTTSHLPSSAVPSNSSSCGHWPAPPQSSPGVCGSAVPATTLKASTSTMSSPEPSCLPNRPILKPPGWFRYCAIEMDGPNELNVVPFVDVQVVIWPAAASCTNRTQT